MGGNNNDDDSKPTQEQSTLRKIFSTFRAKNTPSKPTEGKKRPVITISTIAPTAPAELPPVFPVDNKQENTTVPAPAVTLSKTEVASRDIIKEMYDTETKMHASLSAFVTICADYNTTLLSKTPKEKKPFIISNFFNENKKTEKIKISEITDNEVQLFEQFLEQSLKLIQIQQKIIDLMKPETFNIDQLSPLLLEELDLLRSLTIIYSNFPQPTKLLTATGGAHSNTLKQLGQMDFNAVFMLPMQRGPRWKDLLQALAEKGYEKSLPPANLTTLNTQISEKLTLQNDMLRFSQDKQKLYKYQPGPDFINLLLLCTAYAPNELLFTDIKKLKKTITASQKLLETNQAARKKTSVKTPSDTNPSQVFVNDKIMINTDSIPTEDIAKQAYFNNLAQAIILYGLNVDNIEFVQGTAVTNDKKEKYFTLAENSAALWSMMTEVVISPEQMKTMDLTQSKIADTIVKLHKKGAKHLNVVLSASNESKSNLSAEHRDSGVGSSIDDASPRPSDASTSSPVPEPASSLLTNATPTDTRESQFSQKPSISFKADSKKSASTQQLNLTMAQNTAISLITLILNNEPNKQTPLMETHYAKLVTLMKDFNHNDTAAVFEHIDDFMNNLQSTKNSQHTSSYGNFNQFPNQEKIAPFITKIKTELSVSFETPKNNFPGILEKYIDTENIKKAYLGTNRSTSYFFNLAQNNDEKKTPKIRQAQLQRLQAAYIQASNTYKITTATTPAEKRLDKIQEAEWEAITILLGTIGTIQAELKKEHNPLGSKLNNMLTQMEKDIQKNSTFSPDELEGAKLTGMEKLKNELKNKKPSAPGPAK